MNRFAILFACSVAVLTEACQASVLSFEVFDPSLDHPPYNDPGVPPHLPGYGYPELFPIPQTYGDAIAGASTTVGGQVYQYGEQGEGFTPNVNVSYGPFSIFTGGPNLWRTGFGDMDGVLFQASRHVPPDNLGNDYDVLDIVLYADALFDVVLWDMDLAYWLDGAAATINSVKVYDSTPFPFLTPNNEIFSLDDVSVTGDGRLTIDFGGLSSHMLWIRIDSSNLGSPGSEDIAVDNIRFSQQVGTDDTVFDPAVIEQQLQAGAVPEASSILVWCLGAAIAIAFASSRRAIA